MKRLATLRRLGVVLLLPLISPASLLAAPKAAVNVVLITIDTLRADHVGCYGATEVKTPTLDGLAQAGVLFERAISQVPLTWPSHAAILTGTYPFQNGVQDFTGQPLAPQFRTVAQSFKARGYATGAVVSSFVLDRSWGLARGFDYYDDAFSADQFQQKDPGLVERRAAESVDLALAWLKKSARRPFFFWLHLYDPHSPYGPPEPYHTRYSNQLYDGEIAYVDHELGRLIEFLKQRQLYDRSLMVVVSDHGESLGEHGESEHGFFLYNATLRVPLIIKPPAGSGIRPEHLARPVETIAVAPTLLALAGVQDGIERQFQTGGLFEKNAADAAYSETFYPFRSFGWSPLHALESGRYHFIDAPQPELYDLQSDPGEKNNLAAQQAEAVAAFREKLQHKLQKQPFHLESQTSGLSLEAQEKLRALGYVAYRAPEANTARSAGLPDPKSKLWEFNSILKAADAFRAQDYPAGEGLLAKVSETDPRMYIVPFLLGEAALQQARWEEGAAQLRRCLELDPNFDQAMMGLARALLEQNQPEEARQWLDKALKLNPQNYRAWYELAVTARKSNGPSALAALQKALAIQPNFAPARRELGMLYFQQQQYVQAAQQLAKAAQAGVADARLYNSLGISYSRTNRLAKAIHSYRQALKLDPKMAEAHLNLAYAYRRLQQWKAAQSEYDTACRLEPGFCQYVPQVPR